MIRLLLRLAGIKDYEVCQSCETHKQSYEVLKQQLAFERADKQRLTDTLLDIVKPKVIVTPDPVEFDPVKTATSWSRRRAVLEEEDRKNAHTIANSKNLAMPDELLKKKELSFTVVPKTVEELEKELGVSEKEKDV